MVGAEMVNQSDGFVSRNEIARAFPKAANDHEVLTAAVLDVAFDLVLHELHRHGLFDECGLVFKGGTAIRKFRVGHKGRFSFDLDFDTTEDPATVAEMTGEALAAARYAGFRMALTERRGHHSVHIVSDLLPSGATTAKIDFSRRGVCLPADNVTLRPTPLHARYPFDAGFSVPVMQIDENVAEKLSRWNTRPLIRDLADLAEVAPMVSDIERVAAMYVFKSYKNWAASAPNRRPPQPAAPLAGSVEALRPGDFSLQDLVLPTAPSDTEKTHLMTAWLDRLNVFCERVDSHLASRRLQRFLTNTDGRLTHEADRELDKLSAAARAQTPAPAEPSVMSHRDASRPDTATLLPEPASISICAGTVKRNKHGLRGAPCILREGHGGDCRSV